MDDIEYMREAGRLASQVLDYIGDYVTPGIATEELDRLCAEFTSAQGAISAPLNYNGFPKSICTSVNHVVCHGIPNEKKLKDGDIVNLDITVILNEWHGDTSRTFCVGEPSIKAKRLVDATYDAMMLGIEAVKPGAKFGDIGHAIQTYAEEKRLSVVTEYCGHGIGKVFHTNPQVLHFGEAGTGATIESGMFFTIEPMLNIGKARTKELSDGWTVVTRDRSLSAQFEHTIAVVDSGYEILTIS